MIVNGAGPTTLQTTASAVSSVIIAGQILTAGGRVTVGGDILSLAPSGTGIVVIGTMTVGGGEATATASGKQKNGGERVTGGNFEWHFKLMGVQSLFMVLGAFLLH